MLKVVLALLVIVPITVFVSVIIAATTGSPQHPQVPSGNRDDTAAPDRKWTGPLLSQPERVILIALAVLLVGIAVALGIGFGVGWVVLPLGVWVLTYVAIQALARARTVRRAEAKNREIQDKRRREHQRVNEFGPEGVKLVGRAEVAARMITLSEGAREGWLGELDFRPDLAIISNRLRWVTSIRKVMAESSAIPNPTGADIAMLTDAERVVMQLDKDVRQRVTLLEDCAQGAEEVDRTLRDEREQARIAEQRDDVRSRLTAMLYGVEAGTPTPPFDSAVAVKAMVTAFLELKGVLEEHRLNVGATEAVDGNWPQPRADLAAEFRYSP